jgi:cytochrome c oxidase subunit 2
MIKWLPLTFQNLEVKNIFLIDWLHDYILIFLIFVLVLVGGILLSLSKNNILELQIHEAPTLEFVWTIIPGIILIFIGIPSLSILYRFEGVDYPDITIKITGHQWYWSYDYSDFPSLEFDSYLKPIFDLKLGEPRLLETDNHTVVPVSSSIRFIITSSDVLHSWAVPSMGVKADANPGRINILFTTNLNTVGLFYGQCSEICGANHSFIPICLEITPFTNFGSWSRLF